MTSSGNVAATRHDRVLLITLDNQARRNACDIAMAARLGSLLQEADADDAVGCIVITGAGADAFCSGHDLKEMAADPSGMFDNEALLLPRSIDTPTIAAVNGVAYAGGFMLAAACDMRICDPRAVFSSPAASMGLLPVTLITRLPFLTSHSAAFDLLASSRRVDAAEALRIGLANRVSAPGKCVAEALESARVIASHAPEIVRQIKTCIGILAADGLGAADRFEQASAGRQPKGEEAVRIFEARISGLGKGTKGA